MIMMYHPLQSLQTDLETLIEIQWKDVDGYCPSDVST